jgi:hypothetical protein
MMGLVWDTAQDNIWFARYRDHCTGLWLHAVLEGLPDSEEWDWAVWLPDEPKIARRGVARSRMDASVAAEEAANQCLRLVIENLAKL